MWSKHSPRGTQNMKRYTLLLLETTPPPHMPPLNVRKLHVIIIMLVCASRFLISGVSAMFCTGFVFLTKIDSNDTCLATTINKFLLGCKSYFYVVTANFEQSLKITRDYKWQALPVSFHRGIDWRILPLVSRRSRSESCRVPWQPVGKALSNCWATRCSCFHSHEREQCRAVSARNGLVDWQTRNPTNVINRGFRRREKTPSEHKSAIMLRETFFSFS